MTIGWAIIAVAVLYLLDKHSLMRRALKLSGIVLAVIAVGYGSLLGWSYLQERWDAHQFAKNRECFSSSTGKSHPVNQSLPYCDVDDEVRE
jgi:hypothetical protein